MGRTRRSARRCSLGYALPSPLHRGGVRCRRRDTRLLPSPAFWISAAGGRKERSGCLGGWNDRAEGTGGLMRVYWSRCCVSTDARSDDCSGRAATLCCSAWTRSVAEVVGALRRARGGLGVVLWIAAKSGERGGCGGCWSIMGWVLVDGKRSSLSRHRCRRPYRSRQMVFLRSVVALRPVSMDRARRVCRP